MTYLRRHDISSPPSSSSQEASSTEVPEPTTDISDNGQDLLIALRKGKRQCTLHPISHFVSTDGISSTMQQFVHAMTVHTIPSGHQQALLNLQWKQAMQ
ncbi:hypothetical protein QML37_31150, partial [Klebsiella pneumoniae]|uniref:hypothetical protein n=1 Tax=Klebsiella pneumoniae TaxID=573 RepID=UPI003A80739E